MSVITLVIIFIGGYMVGEAIGWKRGFRVGTTETRFWMDQADDQQAFFLASLAESEEEADRILEIHELKQLYKNGGDAT